MKKLYAIAAAALFPLSVHSADQTNLYLRGDVSNWGADEQFLMDNLGDGRYSLQVENLQGNFKFADDEWVTQYGAGPYVDITGNCTVPVDKSQYYTENFNAPFNLATVNILLDTSTNTVTFSGMSEDQINPDYNPNVTKFGCFIYDADLKMQYEASLKAAGVYEVELADVVPSYKICISSAFINTNLPEAEFNATLLSYLYGSSNLYHDIEGDSQFSLTTSPDNLNETMFTFMEGGNYLLVVDTNTMTLSVEKTDVALYICGNVWSEGGAYNNFLTPSQNNLDIYEREFRLIQIGDEFKGHFRLSDDENLQIPQFRFFTGLRGWNPNYSLGSVESGFFVLTVELTDGSATYPVVKHGLGNWGIQAPGKWFSAYVNLSEMKVRFVMDESGVELIFDMEPTGCQSRYFNLHGVEIEKPEKGIFIQVIDGKPIKIVK